MTSHKKRLRVAAAAQGVGAPDAVPPDGGKTMV